MITAANSTTVSAYPHAWGSHRLMKPTSTAPESPAIAPPITSEDVRSDRRFLPSESATTSLSRAARSVRPYGELVIRLTNQYTASATRMATMP